MKQRFVYTILALFIFLASAFVSSAPYLIYNDGESHGNIIETGKDCSYLNSSSGSFVYEDLFCKDESFCRVEYNFLECSAGQVIQTIKNESCTPCEYGCYKYGCYNSKISCDNLTDCKMYEDEIFEVDEYLTFGIENMRTSSEWFNFNRNNRGVSIMHNLGERQELYYDDDEGYTYYITLKKISSDYIVFDLEREIGDILEDGCVETDNGKDYNTYGKNTITKNHRVDGQFADMCLDSTRLYEIYCDISEEEFSTETYDCPNGCRDGACILGTGVNASNSYSNASTSENNVPNNESNNEFCSPTGLRSDGNYCDQSGIWKNQTESGVLCENNFECSSNLCINSQCISGSFWQKIMNWFSKLFD